METGNVKKQRDCQTLPEKNQKKPRTLKQAQLPLLRRNHAGFQLAHPKLRQDTIPFSVLLYIGEPY
jgi:hypothetical protein